MRRYRAALNRMLVVLTLSAAATAAAAHPMPNTVIQVAADDAAATLDIAIPLPELRLALPTRLRDSTTLLTGGDRVALDEYFDQHVVLRSRQGERCAHQVEDVAIWSASDPGAGDYEELRLQVRMPANKRCDPRAFVLTYDAVIHQVANHWAAVRAAPQPAPASPDDDDAPLLGLIAFDFTASATPALRIDLATADSPQGLSTAILLGFHHVLRGLDHLLFLVALLVVAPLRVVGGRWSLFQGWPYTLRRFIGISAAFTLGHSLALLLGVFVFAGAAMAMVEVAIAVSILVAAVHAIRPLFPAREWLVAVGFGMFHGLAFADTLSGLHLGAADRALTVLRFNIGVEGAQLVAMGCALPLLFASRWRHYDALRVGLMIGVLALAGWWAVERVTALR